MDAKVTDDQKPQSNDRYRSEKYFDASLGCESLGVSPF